MAKMLDRCDGFGNYQMHNLSIQSMLSKGIMFLKDRMVLCFTDRRVRTFTRLAHVVAHAQVRLLPAPPLIPLPSPPPRRRGSFDLASFGNTFRPGTPFNPIF
jgi:hypothetical protein